MGQPPEPRTSPLRVLAVAAVFAVTALLAAPLVAMVAVCETAEGRAFGCGFLALAITPALALLAGRRRPAVAGTSLGASILLLVFVVVRAPAGPGDPASGLTSHWLEPHGYARFSPANLIPELDQIKMEDTSFKPLIHKYFGDSYTGCVTYQLPVQREMHAEEPWRALGGSGMHEGWSEVWSKVVRGEGRPPRHWYRYLPPHRPGERLPVVVFFHGFGSNAKHDLWCWKALADQVRCALLHPSMGFGLIPEGDLGIDRFLAEWKQDPSLDWSRAFVAGLSNGAVRAARAATLSPGSWRGVILLSPVLRGVAECGNRIWRGTGPIDQAPYPPVLAIHGAHDWAVTPGYMQQREQQLTARGISFSLKTYPDMDHYVNFRARDRWHPDVRRWMAEVEAGRVKSSGS